MFGQKLMWGVCVKWMICVFQIAWIKVLVMFKKICISKVFPVNTIMGKVFNVFTGGGWLSRESPQGPFWIIPKKNISCGLHVLSLSNWSLWLFHKWAQSWASLLIELRKRWWSQMWASRLGLSPHANSRSRKKLCHLRPKPRVTSHHNLSIQILWTLLHHIRVVHQVSRWLWREWEEKHFVWPSPYVWATFNTKSLLHPSSHLQIFCSMVTANAMRNAMSNVVHNTYPCNKIVKIHQ